jgi:hypothetical protein
MGLSSLLDLSYTTEEDLNHFRDFIFSMFYTVLALPHVLQNGVHGDVHLGNWVVIPCKTHHTFKFEGQIFQPKSDFVPLLTDFANSCFKQYGRGVEDNKYVSLPSFYVDVHRLSKTLYRLICEKKVKTGNSKLAHNIADFLNDPLLLGSSEGRFGASPKLSTFWKMISSPLPVNQEESTTFSVKKKHIDIQFPRSDEDTNRLEKQTSALVEEMFKVSTMRNQSAEYHAAVLKMMSEHVLFQDLKVPCEGICKWSIPDLNTVWYGDFNDLPLLYYLIS